MRGRMIGGGGGRWGGTRNWSFFFFLSLFLFSFSLFSKLSHPGHDPLVLLLHADWSRLVLKSIASHTGLLLQSHTHLVLSHHSPHTIRLTTHLLVPLICVLYILLSVLYRVLNIARWRVRAINSSYICSYTGRGPGDWEGYSALGTSVLAGIGLVIGVVTFYRTIGARQYGRFLVFWCRSRFALFAWCTAYGVASMVADRGGSTGLSQFFSSSVLTCPIMAGLDLLILLGFESVNMRVVVDVFYRIFYIGNAALLMASFVVVGLFEVMECEREKVSSFFWVANGVKLLCSGGTTIMVMRLMLRKAVKPIHPGLRYGQDTHISTQALDADENDEPGPRARLFLVLEPEAIRVLPEAELAVGPRARICEFPAAFSARRFARVIHVCAAVVFGVWIPMSFVLTTLNAIVVRPVPALNCWDVSRERPAWAGPLELAAAAWGMCSFALLFAALAAGFRLGPMVLRFWLYWLRMNWVLSLLGLMRGLSGMVAGRSGVPGLIYYALVGPLILGLIDFAILLSPARARTRLFLAPFWCFFVYVLYSQVVAYLGYAGETAPCSKPGSSSAARAATSLFFLAKIVGLSKSLHAFRFSSLALVKVFRVVQPTFALAEGDRFAIGAGRLEVAARDKMPELIPISDDIVLSIDDED